MSVQIDGSTGNIIAIKADYSGDVSIGGTLTYEDVTNIDAVGLITARNGIKVDDLGVQVGTGATIDGATNTLTFLTNGSERVRVGSTGDVGINCTPHSNAGINLHIHGDNTSSEIRLTNTTTGTGANGGILQQSGNTLYLSNTENGNTVFETNGSERVRITSGGNLRVGSSGAPSNKNTVTPLAHVDGSGVSGGFQINRHTSVGGGGAQLLLSATRGSSITGHTILQDNDGIGSLVFAGSDGGEFVTGVEIQAVVDGTPGDDDLPAELLFKTNSGGAGPTEAMRIDSSQRLLIGSTAVRGNLYNSSGAETRLQVEGTSFTTSSAALIRNSNDANDAEFIIAKSRGGSVGSNTVVQSGDNLGAVSFQGSDGAQFVESASITTIVDGTPGSNDMPGRLVFATTADGASTTSERFRIAAAGWVQFYPSSTVDAVNIAHPAAAGTSVRYLYGAANGTQTFTVFNNGNVQNTNNSYGAISDIKLKENIVDAGSQWDDLKTIQVRNYNFKAETGQPTHTQIGVVAQEVETVSPGLVSESPDRDDDGNDLGTVTKSVNYSVLYMKAIKALQEAQTRIETLETKVAALEG